MGRGPCVGSGAMRGPCCGGDAVKGSPVVAQGGRSGVRALVAVGGDGVGAV